MIEKMATATVTDFVKRYNEEEQPKSRVQQMQTRSNSKIEGLEFDVKLDLDGRLSEYSDESLAYMFRYPFRAQSRGSERLDF